MIRFIGAAMLFGLTAWCAYDPTVLTETLHALFSSLFDLEDDRTQRDHARAMDALDRIGGRHG